MKKINIATPYITLGQFLKVVGAIDTGGQVKFFLQESQVKINEEKENRRGKKLYPGDKIWIEDIGTFEVNIEG